jgi:hypothetical protein
MYDESQEFAPINRLRTGVLMKTSADRLKWFLNFAQLEWTSSVDPEDYILGSQTLPPLPELRESEYLKLKNEFIEFICGNANEPFRFAIIQRSVEVDKDGRSRKLATFPPLRTVLEEFVTRDNLARLSVRSRWRLSAYTREETEATKRSMTINFGHPTVHFNMRTAKWVIEHDHPWHLFFIRFGLALMEEGTSQIQSCPECSRAFYRVRKQKYCSKTCINRVSRRKWLENPKNKKKERQWARQRYERRVQKKTSSKIRIQSRKKGEAD